MNLIPKKTVKAHKEEEIKTVKAHKEEEIKTVKAHKEEEIILLIEQLLDKKPAPEDRRNECDFLTNFLLVQFRRQCENATTGQVSQEEKLSPELTDKIIERIKKHENHFTKYKL